VKKHGSLSPWLWRGALLLLLALAWGLRLYRLDAQSFWYDEGYAVYVAGLRPAEALLWSSRDVVPPLHTYLLSLWLPFSGWTEFGARFLSVWMGTMTVAAVARMGTDLCSRWVGWGAGLLATLSPFYVWHSQDARMYATQAALGFLATAALVRGLRRPERWRRWAAVSLLNGLALYTQTTGGFQVAFHGLVVLATGLRDRGRRIRLLRGGGALLGAVLCWLPWVAYALPFLRENAGYWPGQLGWQFFVSEAWRGFVTGGLVGRELAPGVMLTWAAAGVVGLLALAALGGERGRRAAGFLLAHLAVPVALMAWLFRGVPKFSPRYLMLASPPVFVLAAAAAEPLLRRPGPRRLLGGAVLAALTLTEGLGLVNWYGDPNLAKSDFRAAARLVQAQGGQDDLVLLVPGHMFPVWQFYAGPVGWRALPDDPVLDVRHVLHYRDVVGPLNAWLRERSDVWLVEWEPWVVDPTGVAPALLAWAGEEVSAAQLADLRVRRYRIQADRLPLPSDPILTLPQETALDLPLRLLGCRLPDRSLADHPLAADCYWDAQGALPLHLNVSARLVDDAGVEWGRADGPISGPYLVAGRWPVGEPVLGQYGVAPFPGTPPGDFYCLRLHVYGPDGASYGTAAVSPIIIAPPERKFTQTLAGGIVSALRLDGLTLEAVVLRTEQVRPGDAFEVEAVWRVDGPFTEPALRLGDDGAVHPLLPLEGATAAWQPGDRYRTISRLPVSPHALGGPTTVWVVSGMEQFPVGEMRVDVERAFDMPAGIAPLAYTLGEGIELAGAQLDCDLEGVALVLYWRANRSVETSYTVFVHLVGPDGEIYTQADSLPQAGRHPTPHWLPGEIVADPYRLVRPADAPSGRYRLVTGMYEGATGDRLPVRDGAGRLLPDDVILLGELEAP